MSNPRELLARLNVPAVRYEIGRGGIPELTNIDIAGALGMIPAGFARDVLMVVWWPDGCQRLAESMAEGMRIAILTEYAARERAHAAAKLDHHLAEGAIAAKPKPLRTEKEKKIVEDLKSDIERARRRCWPWNSDRYVLIFPTVVEEMRQPRKCSACQGRGTYVLEGLVKDCRRCAGTGVRHGSIGWRAERLGIKDRHRFRVWEPVYEWVYRKVADAEAAGAKELTLTIARDVVDAA